MERMIQLLQTNTTMAVMAMEFGVVGVVTACAGLVWLRFSHTLSR